jgi:hypothetical protein
MGNLFDTCLGEELIEYDIETLWLLKNDCIDSPIILRSDYISVSPTLFVLDGN